MMTLILISPGFFEAFFKRSGILDESLRIVDITYQDLAVRLCLVALYVDNEPVPGFLILHAGPCHQAPAITDGADQHWDWEP